MDREQDQFEQRREKRAQQRQKQIQEQKRLRRNLILTGVIALACFVGIFLLARNADRNAPAAEPEKPATQQHSSVRPQETEATEETTSRRKASSRSMGVRWFSI